MPIAHDWLARRAQLSPDRVALIDALRGERPITFREWNATAQRTAHLLHDTLGVRRGDRVAVLAMNCVEYLDLLFACAKLGAILQPLNWRLSPEELKGLLADAEPLVLVYGPDFQAQVEAVRPHASSVRHIVALEDSPSRPSTDVLFFAREAQPDSPLPPLELEASDPWVLCYTGGSTGLPKAAILTHGSITANAANTVLSWGLTADDVALLNAPLFHTGGLNVFTTPLVYVGGASVVCRGFEVEQVFDLVHRGAVSLVFGVPTMFIEMQRHPRFDTVDFSRLKLLISGGAPCPGPVFERFFARGVPFKTGYGLTEAGPNNFWLPPGLVRSKPGAVGVPLFHVDARLDGDGQEGELLLRGPHLCAGYWRRPEETAKTFAGGWLHTGDLAERDADNCYRIVGRVKDLIISGGENIYPSEVESVLAGHPEVAEVAVIGVPDPKWGEVPRALIVSRPGTAPTAETLLAYCQGRLARYKTPKSVSFVDALPRTAAGKVDRRALATRHGTP
ncbi:acyl-CoA synthetase [Hyalangium rubrum]|uniref:Long-chain fatty acid--CoA ligase n=1 Tax=Hyalangium rubrum TaxID=3103134 RepID=A0ABU5GZP7_9BACT|nr:long-chain fatty acid--CoA ligase [Hyalangium sp. s54d21]MDY7226359.1 long-chain fatty acid--CoA ligase [Hyalangium sp. s54d21]